MAGKKKSTKIMRARGTPKVTRMDSRTASKLRAVRKAAISLIAAVDRVHLSEAYERVWAIAQSHQGAYSGPQYVRQLAALRDAIEKSV